MKREQEGSFSRVGRWLFHNHFLVTVLIGCVGIAVITLGDGIAGSKHVPSCEAIVINLESGTVSGLTPFASATEIKDQFPCYTGFTKQGSNYNEGGGVFSKHHRLFFYTKVNRIEIRHGFDGEIQGIAGERTPERFVKLLGEPLEERREPKVRDGIIYDASLTYAMAYGKLLLLEKEGQILAVHFIGQRDQ